MASDDKLKLGDNDWWGLLAAYEVAKLATDASNAQQTPADHALALAHGEENERLALEHAKAIDALLLAPAPDRRALYTKLQIFNDWQVEDGWHTAREIVEQLAADARHLLMEV